MAEVPEHLLQRSAERRAALTGVGVGDADAAATPAVTGGDAAPAAAAQVAASAAAPAKVTPTQPAFIEPVDKATFERIGAIRTRRIPAWAMGVLAVVPLWGVLYIGAFGERPTHDEHAIDGATTYGNNCASCHGASGGGGVGPKLSGSEAALTFPNIEDHVEWVKNGSTGVRGKTYGDPNRAGGQRVATSGGMPGFGSRLSEEEIAAVVEYEREGL